MKLIIAGTRDIVDYEKVKQGIALFQERHPNFIITEIVSGGARGVDKLGEDWANENKIPIKRFDADWKNIDTLNARIRLNQFGTKYNMNAGKDRNILMANYADGLLSIWDGSSPGSKHMISLMVNKPTYVLIVKKPKLRKSQVQQEYIGSIWLD